MATPAAEATPGPAGLWGWGRKRAGHFCRPQVTGSPAGATHAVRSVPGRGCDSCGSECLQVQFCEKVLLRCALLVYSLSPYLCYIGFALCTAHLIKRRPHGGRGLGGGSSTPGLTTAGGWLEEAWLLLYSLLPCSIPCHEVESGVAQLLKAALCGTTNAS